MKTLREVIGNERAKAILSEYSLGGEDEDVLNGILEHWMRRRGLLADKVRAIDGLLMGERKHRIICALMLAQLELSLRAGAKRRPLAISFMAT